MGRNKRKREKYISQESVKKKSKEPEELRELALKEIACLNDEICHLEDEIDQTEYTSAGQYTIETLQRVTSDLLRNVQPSSLQENNGNEIEKDIDALQSRLSSLEAFTGIKFVENSISVLSKTQSTSVLLRRLSGTCHVIPFTVEFEVQEDEQRSSTCSDSASVEENNTVLNRLKIDVTEPLASQELSKFIQATEKDKALQPFFIGLIQYAEWHKDRQQTFQHFKMKYPETVQLIGMPTGSQAIQLQNRNKPGLVFMVYWRLDIDESGQVIPDFQIHAVAPLKQTGQKDKHSLLRSVPEQFQKVLPTLGFEQSIELVIGIVCR